VPIRTATWGPFVLITLEGNKTAHVSTTVGEEWLGSAVSVLSTAGVDTSLHHVATREYLINCNWKVYCDNYLDGGYHVPHAHSALASSLDLSSYSTTVRTCHHSQLLQGCS
jgi:choline monooxygenase